jgi:hypothetical protein
MKFAGFLRVAMLGALAVWIFLMDVSPAFADILISPRRAILTDAARHAVLSLHNPGTIARTYSLKWVERRLTESGTLIDVKEGENPRSIAGMVRFAPRRVVVAPGQTQTVRLDYQPPAELVAGEYRSFLRIGQEPLANGNSGTPVASGEQDGMTFRVDALLSFSVPVFVRHGQGSGTAAITAIAPTLVKQETGGKDESALQVTLTRSGEFSTYGRLVVYQQLNANAPVEEISQVEGVAMYVEVKGTKRVINLKPGSQLIPGSYIRVTYEGEGEERGTVFAERSFQVGQ